MCLPACRASALTGKEIKAGELTERHSGVGGWGWETGAQEGVMVAPASDNTVKGQTEAPPPVLHVGIWMSCREWGTLKFGELSKNLGHSLSVYTWDFVFLHV